MLQPPADDITGWLPTPRPGTVYTYRSVTLWHDGSQNIVTTEYTVVEVDTDLSYVKFLNMDTGETEYLLADSVLGYLYRSTDDTVDTGDTALLKVPVDTDSTWSSGGYLFEISGTEGDFDLDGKNITGIVDVRAVYYEVSFRWSFRHGLVEWTENYTDDSYMQSYTRTLVSVQNG